MDIMQSSLVEDMEGVEATGMDILTDQEKRILELYDRLEELQLEMALLKARGVLSQDTPVEATEEDIKAAEQDLLRSKALYQIRTNIVEHVLVGSPMLRAVQNRDTGLIEQDLLRLTKQRDALSTTLAELSSTALSAQNELTQVSAEHTATAQKNAELATEMLALADAAAAQDGGGIDAAARARLEELGAAMRASRQRWRILKGTASATVVGSGMDWARDAQLLEMVMDEGDEEEE